MRNIRAKRLTLRVRLPGTDGMARRNGTIHQHSSPTIAIRGGCGASNVAQTCSLCGSRSSRPDLSNVRSGRPPAARIANPCYAPIWGTNRPRLASKCSKTSARTGRQRNDGPGTQHSQGLSNVLPHLPANRPIGDWPIQIPSDRLSKKPISDCPIDSQPAIDSSHPPAPTPLPTAKALQLSWTHFLSW